MRRVVPALLVLAAALAAPLLGQPAPSPAQQTSGKVLGVTVPLEVREQFLGASGERTVVRFTLTLSRADLREKAGLAPRVYSFFVAGEAKDAKGGPSTLSASRSTSTSATRGSRSPSPSPSSAPSLPAT